MKLRGIEVPREQLAEFCKRHHIRRFSLSGSILRADFGPDSDVDILVEFEPGHTVGMVGFQGIEQELTAMVGRKVDLNTPGFLSKYFRDEVLSEAEIQYEAA